MDSAGLGLRGLTGLLLALNLGVLAVGLSAHFWPSHEPLTPAMNGEQIQLAAVMQPGTGRAKATVEKSAPRAPPDEARCLVWDHIDSDRVLSIEKALVEAGIKAADRAWNLNEKLGWWVFLPPYQDTAAMRAAVDDARRRGVPDAEPVHVGAMINAVSLGMFPDPDRARVHAETMLGRGFKDVRYGLRPSVTTVRLALAKAPSIGLAEAIREASRGIMPEACAGAPE